MSPPTKPFIRLPGPWPFPDAITQDICRCAGREASAFLFIALGERKNGGLAAREATYYEPFTFWDWHGVNPDHVHGGLKRQRVWERKRGFCKSKSGNGGEFGREFGEEFGYPSERERWRRFREGVERVPVRGGWIRRIAMAHWMGVEDLQWIAENLPQLQGLDLSDTPFRFGDHPFDSSLQSRDTSEATEIPALEDNKALGDLLLRLTWLGTPDFRRQDDDPQCLLSTFLPECTNLKTLCIRGKYTGEVQPASMDNHQSICRFISSIALFTPATVTTLELRLSFPFLDRLVEELVKSKSNITRIGIDLGAWVQVYPLRTTSDELKEDEVKRASIAAARKTRFETYEEEHNKVLPVESKWWLPEPPNSYRDEKERSEAKHAFEWNFYRDDGGSDPSDITGYPVSEETGCPLDNGPEHHSTLTHSLDDIGIDTLPRLLYKLYEMGQVFPKGPGGINLFPLEPEWQVNSTNPVQPSALVQSDAHKDVNVRRGSRYQSFQIGQLQEVYYWLNTTFRWRPVFDWDRFMNLDPHNQDNNLIPEIAKQFEYMRQAGIPIKLLIGRRHPDQSSLYWGWPYEKSIQTQDPAKPFTTNLELIAPLVDTLSVFYDLRNPLDEERLEDIDSQQPYRAPAATCPRILCPWRETNNCPFEKQWNQNSTATSSQKMANKHGIRPVSSPTRKSHLPLASNLASDPPVGEDADEHTSDDSDTDDLQPNPTLHQLARRAAYEREAVGWQRFWSEYSPKLTNLTELHVRMPLCFDKVGSLRLAKLLNPNKGWKIAAFADERQCFQTREDLVRQVGSGEDLYTHVVEDKVWPAGRFVRRTWVRMNPPPKLETKSLEKGADNVEAAGEEASINSGNRSTATSGTEERIEKVEREELQKAIQRAEEATRREQELEARLKSTNKRPPPATSLDLHADLESKLTGAYGQQIHRVAKREWRREMQAYIFELGDKDIEKIVGEAGSTSSANEGEVEVDDAERVREVLRSTREQLERRLQHFHLEDVFRVHDGLDGTKKNGVALVEHTREYADEEERRCNMFTVSKISDQAAIPPMSALGETTDVNDLVGHLLEDLGKLRSGSQQSPQQYGFSPGAFETTGLEDIPPTDKEKGNIPVEDAFDDDSLFGSDGEDESDELGYRPSPPGEDIPTQPLEEQDGSIGLDSLIYTQAGVDVEQSAIGVETATIFVDVETAATSELVQTKTGDDNISVVEVQTEQSIHVETSTSVEQIMEVERTIRIEQTTHLQQRIQVEQSSQDEEAAGVANAPKELTETGQAPQDVKPTKGEQQTDNEGPTLAEKPSEVEKAPEVPEVQSPTNPSIEEDVPPTRKTNTPVKKAGKTTKKRKSPEPDPTPDSSEGNKPPPKKRATPRTKKHDTPTLESTPDVSTPEEPSQPPSEGRPVRKTRARTKTPVPISSDSEFSSDGDSDDGVKTTGRKRGRTHSAELYEPPGTKRATRGRATARARGAKGRGKAVGAAETGTEGGSGKASTRGGKTGGRGRGKKRTAEVELDGESLPRKRTRRGGKGAEAEAE